MAIGDITNPPGIGSAATGAADWDTHQLLRISDSIVAEINCDTDGDSYLKTYTVTTNDQVQIADSVSISSSLNFGSAMCHVIDDLYFILYGTGTGAQRKLGYVTVTINATTGAIVLAPAGATSGGALYWEISGTYLTPLGCVCLTTGVDNSSGDKQILGSITLWNYPYSRLEVLMFEIDDGTNGLKGEVTSVPSSVFNQSDDSGVRQYYECYMSRMVFTEYIMLFYYYTPEGGAIGRVMLANSDGTVTMKTVNDEGYNYLFSSTPNSNRHVVNMGSSTYITMEDGTVVTFKATLSGLFQVLESTELYDVFTGGLQGFDYIGTENGYQYYIAYGVYSAESWIYSFKILNNGTGAELVTGRIKWRNDPFSTNVVYQRANVVVAAMSFRDLVFAHEVGTEVDEEGGITEPTYITPLTDFVTTIIHRWKPGEFNMELLIGGIEDDYELPALDPPMLAGEHIKALSSDDLSRIRSSVSNVTKLIGT